MAAAAHSADEQQRAAARYRGLREELESLYNKLGVIDSDRSEHE
jgi:hypothetical protein